MIKRTIGAWGVAVMLAASLSLTACGPTESQKVAAHLPEVIPTAYMLFYDKGSVTAADSEAILLEIAAALEAAPNIKANINGFRGPDEPADQDKLRAEAVLKYLVDHGVDPKRAFANPMGLAEAIGKDDDGTARRRVEIFISPIPAAAK